MQHVRMGVTTEQDRIGNAGADSMATQAAAQHAVAPEIAADAKLRRHAAVQTQSMMVSILKVNVVCWLCAQF